MKAYSPFLTSTIILFVSKKCLSYLHRYKLVRPLFSLSYRLIFIIYKYNCMGPWLVRHDSMVFF